MARFALTLCYLTANFRDNSPDSAWLISSAVTPVHKVIQSNQVGAAQEHGRVWRNDRVPTSPDHHVIEFPVNDRDVVILQGFIC